jgi:glucan phosphoethanolaminetransferase (alkaline phosphatase superfamily)
MQGSLAYQLTILTYGGVIMKNFFKNLWDKIKNFVSEHKSVFETILKVFLVLLDIAWAILMLYPFSEILLSGIEKDSAIRVAFAIAGYIFIAWYTYWITFVRRQDDDFREIKSALWNIRVRQSSHSVDNFLSKSEFKVSMLEQKYEIADKLREIERKIDKLIDEQK